MSDPKPEHPGRGLRRPGTSGRRLAWLLCALYLGFGLAALPEYGPTWDTAGGDYAYGESTLQYLLTGTGSPDPRTPARFGRRQPHPEFTVHFAWYQLYPLASTICAASARALFHRLDVLPAFIAWHLPVLLGAVLLLFCMVRFLSPRLGPWAAGLAGVLLVTNPRFFGHSMNNLKDVPETVLYTLCIGASYLALRRGSWSLYCTAAVCAGAAMAQKGNAVFIPVQLGLFLVAERLLTRWLGAGSASSAAEDSAPIRFRPARALAAVGLALGVYLLLSPMFWSDTLARIGAHLTALLESGNSASSGDGYHVSWRSLATVGLTTPVTVLALALVGAVAPGISPRLRLLLLISVAVPIGRTTLPGMRDFDGVRHFLEFLPPLCALAGHGGAFLARCLARRRARPGPWMLLVCCLMLLPGLLGTARTHPHGTASFNLLSGGASGALRRGDLDATDYWAGSYWQGLAWLRDHAPATCEVVVPVAPHVARCGAPLRLLPTQRIVAPVRVSATAPTYVMYVTRRYFYNVGVLHLERTSTPVHEIAIEGAPILRIHRLSPARIPQLTQLWRREAEANRQWWDFHQWMQAHAPEQLTRVVVVLDAAYRADRLPEAVDYLRGELPADSPHRLEVVGDAYAWLQTHLWAYKNLDEHRAQARAQAQAAQAKAQAGDR